MDFFYSTGVTNAQHSISVRRWITLCAALVALMVLLGGATRLTESGLSIVKWKLVTGILPPMSEAAWEKEFTEYQTSPQYEQVNRDFGVSDFKHIYWLEYLHRLLGRVLGLVIILPFLFFAVRRQLAPPILKRMAIAVMLVAAQGAVGWLMVASGLVDQPRVAPIKLALHLSLAFTLFGLLLWTRWRLVEARGTGTRVSAWAARVLFFVVAMQIVLGALVAGLDAGLSYNTYPLMDGAFIPDGLYLLEPWWKNHLESMLTVQFQHRMGALLVVICAILFAFRGWASQRREVIALLAVTALQFALGIVALLTVVALYPAIAHQFMALVLFAVSLRLIYINAAISQPVSR